jgi:hypothetical protein
MWHIWEKNKYRVFVAKLEGKNQLGGLGVDGRKF